jgi:nicotinamide riboside transporter PnuC
MCSVGAESAGDDFVLFAASLACWLDWLHAVAAAGRSVAHWIDSEYTIVAVVAVAGVVARLNSERPDDVAARSDA